MASDEEWAADPEGNARRVAEEAEAEYGRRLLAALQAHQKPMKQLTRAELEERIRQVEGHLERSIAAGEAEVERGDPFITLDDLRFPERPMPVMPRRQRRFGWFSSHRPRRTPIE